MSSETLEPKWEIESTCGAQGDDANQARGCVWPIDGRPLKYEEMLLPDASLGLVTVANVPSLGVPPQREILTPFPAAMSSRTLASSRSRASDSLRRGTEVPSVSACRILRMPTHGIEQTFRQEFAMADEFSTSQTRTLMSGWRTVPTESETT
jgi:hypothetical protein